jgi:lysophospholipase L1-like esterase
MRLGISLAVVATTLVLPLAAVEVVVRTLGVAPRLAGQIGGLVADEHLLYRHAPHSVARGRSASDEFDFVYEHNSQGFRDVDRPLAKAPGTLRVVALGDSFTYGEGVGFEETWPSRLEQMLSDSLAGGPRVEVVQLGLRRYFPAAQRSVLRHVGLAFDPDVVIHATVPNDVIDTHLGLAAVYVDENGFLRNSSARSFGRVGGWLFVHSHTMRIVLRAASARRQRSETTVVWADIFRADGAHESDWRSMEADLDSIAVLAQGHGASFVLSYLPMQGPWTPQGRYPEERVRRWAAAREVRFAGLFEAFRARTDRGTPLFWPRDGHPTPAGQDLIAEQLVPVVLETLRARRSRPTP